jgi:phage gpG-like protein
MDQSGVAYDASDLGRVFRELEQSLPGATQAALGEIAGILVGMVEDEFQTQGRGKWPPFAKSTLEERLKKGGSPKLLQDTGNFVGSIAQAVESDAAIAFTNVPYAVYHTSAEPRHVIPYRNPFDLPDDEVLQHAEDIALAAVAAFGGKP